MAEARSWCCHCRPQHIPSQATSPHSRVSIYPGPISTPSIDLGPHSRRVRIGEDGGRAALLVDGVVQSISPEDGLIGGGYWAAMVPDDPPRHALILGLGGGTLARLLQARWGDVPVVGVDNDREIVATAANVGWLPQRGLEVVMGDAFEYVQTCQRRFDFVAVDLFRGQRLAGRAFGKPFLRRVRTLLEPRGRVAVNMFMDHQERERELRISTFFEIYKHHRVGGNVVIHARRRG